MIRITAPMARVTELVESIAALDSSPSYRTNIMYDKITSTHAIVRVIIQNYCRANNYIHTATKSFSTGLRAVQYDRDDLAYANIRWLTLDQWLAHSDPDYWTG